MVSIIIIIIIIMIIIIMQADFVVSDTNRFISFCLQHLGHTKERQKSLGPMLTKLWWPPSIPRASCSVLDLNSSLPVETQIDLCPVDWGRRIHRLILCRGVRSPHNECFGYGSKQFDSKVPVVLDLCGMQSTPSLTPFPGPL